MKWQGISFKACLFAVAAAASCATVSYNVRLQDRTLLISPQFPGKLIYPYFKTVCKNKKKWGIFKHCEKVHTIDTYDLNDKDVLLELLGANFQCQSTSRFKY